MFPECYQNIAGILRTSMEYLWSAKRTIAVHGVGATAGCDGRGR